ncbi:Carnitine O-acetyltransferase [Liparis tanakae]|uniref:Carnitine O-acetyltransferase n=1 Tax=Liparis tanakae TaxID=230148 RepID=A0A4Z2H7D4_9TELE|nr:Carnitine O-acetyltransferase [Liparis tanakae]
MILRNIQPGAYRAWLSRVWRQEPRFFSSVPPQPVPPLVQTLQGYLSTLEPLLPPDELSHTRRMVHEFGSPGGLGPRLQKSLEKRARHTKNWISPWWVQWAYLESRQPLPVHSNPAISLPRRDYNGWRSQLVFASKLIAGVLDFKAKIKTEKPDPKRAPLVPLPMPKKLYFHIDREIKRDIEHAKQNLDILINDLDVNVFNFKKFGKELPKRHNLSPNSFIQVALQLAYYRVHDEVGPACDIASQRMFRGGRTEYIRSPSTQTLKFILAFGDRSVTVLEGRGVDLHLLGLKLQAIEEGLSIPKVYMDTAYGVATHWKLRTGQVPANTDSVMCFGPLVPDGYAICYNPQADHVHFSITAFNCCEETNAETLALTLKDTLCQLQELLQPTV